MPSPTPVLVVIVAAALLMLSAGPIGHSNASVTNYWTLWIKEAARLYPSPDGVSKVSPHTIPVNGVDGDRTQYYAAEAAFWNWVRDTGLTGPLQSWGPEVPINFPSFLNGDDAAVAAMLGFSPQQEFEKLQASDVIHALYTRASQMTPTQKATMESYLIWSQYQENLNYYFDTFLQSYIQNSALTKLLIIESLAAMLVVPPELDLDLDVQVKLVPPPQANVNFNRDKDIGLMVANVLMATVAIIPIVGSAVAAVGSLTTGILGATVLKDRDTNPNLDVKATLYAQTDMTAQAQNVELSRVINQLRQLFDSMQLTREETKMLAQNNWAQVRSILARPSISYSYLMQENILFEKMIIGRMMNAMFTFKFIPVCRAGVPEPCSWNLDTDPINSYFQAGWRMACIATPVSNKYARLNLPLFDLIRERIRVIFGANYWLGQQPFTLSNYLDTHQTDTSYWNDDHLDPDGFAVWKNYRNADEAQLPIYTDPNDYLHDHAQADGFIPYCTPDNIADLNSLFPSVAASADTVATLASYRDSMFDQKMYFSFDNPSNPAQMPYSGRDYFATLSSPNVYDISTATYISWSTMNWRSFLAFVPNTIINFSKGNGFVPIPTEYTWSFVAPAIIVPRDTTPGVPVKLIQAGQPDEEGVGESYAFIFVDGRPGVMVGGAPTLCNNVISTFGGGWMTITVVGNATSTTFYRDTSAFCTVNARPTGYFLKMTGGSIASAIDDLRYWDKKLTPAQIAAVAKGYECFSYGENVRVKPISTSGAGLTLPSDMAASVYPSNSVNVAKTGLWPCASHAINTSTTNITFSLLNPPKGVGPEYYLDRHYRVSVWFQTPLGLPANGQTYRTLLRGRSSYSMITVANTGVMGYLSPSNVFTPSTINVNNLSSGWHHLLFFESQTTGGPTQATYAVDGVYVSTIDTNLSAGFKQDLSVLGGISGQMFMGLISDVRIWTSYPASETATNVATYANQRCYRTQQ